MVFLEATYEVGYHSPCFFGVGSEVLLLAFLGISELPVTFGSSLVSEKVLSHFLEELLAFRSSFFHEVL